MREQDVFVLAEHALKNVIDQIRDEQWAMEMPPTFARRDGRAVTLREIVNYHAYDDAWVPDMLAGKTMEEAGKGTFEGDLLGDDPKGNFARIVGAPARRLRPWTIRSAPSTARSAISQPASISGRSTRSAACAPTTSRR